MTAKLFEIRDKGTFIPVLAVKLDPRHEYERWLLSKAGFGQTPEAQEQYVVLCQIAGGAGHCACDPYDWPDGGRVRTYPVAHKYIIENFNAMQSGDVVDVEFILGERPEKKVSERLTAGGGL